MLKSLSIALFVSINFIVFSQKDASLRQKHFNINKFSLALEGYDPVSYFSGEPKKGNANFTYSYNGIKYNFSSQKNLDVFKQSPDKYEPQYGGWCAYAMGLNGEKVEVDPVNYKITNGKLYLFYRNFFSNTLDDWNKNEKTLNLNADVNWRKIYK